MSSYTGVSPKDPNKYLGPNVYLSSVVTRTRSPTPADYRQPETGKLYPTGSFWLVGKNPTNGIEGALWYLSKIVANVAYWLELNGSGIGPIFAPGIMNIGFSYDAGTGVFTVHGSDGTALSPSNPGFVTMQSKSSLGELVTIAVTQNQFFIDDNGTSEIIGNLFGLTSGISTGSVAMPFFLYAVSNDLETGIAFMISRFPGAVRSPAVGIIGKPGVPVASTQGSFYSLTDLVLTNYDLNPCLCIGAFRMTMSAANDWTVQTLANIDGINHFMEGVIFSSVRGQFGAATGKFFKNNGGTAPDDADGAFVYSIDIANQRCSYRLAFPSIDTAGLGAVRAQLALPFNSGEGSIIGVGNLSNGINITMLQTSIIPFTNNAEFAFVSDIASGILTNANVTLALGIAIQGTELINYG